MGYKTHSIDGQMGEVSLAHVRSYTKQAVIPAGTAGTYALAYVPVGAVITAVRVYRAGGTTATVQIVNGASNVLASPLASTTDAWAATTTLNNATVAAGTGINAVVAGVAGTPTSVTVQVDFMTSVPA
ncbi:hypothetical protein [Nonomuraea sp. LPB2021202275-12-8]|uniref:hypothetical protein n=1 Tax=Nonomuraea sp. LPB2021202275-12-8 TaxID=3120159 RepID=UPI00300CE55B